MTAESKHVEIKDAIEHLDLRYLTVDIAAQRRENTVRVNKLADEFNEQALGVITCSWRDINVPLINVVDGQHRVAACRRVGHTKPLLAHVYYGLSLDQEAALFRMLNNAMLPGHADIFLVRSTEGDKCAVECVQMLADYGWRIHGTTEGTAFNATATLERVYALGPAYARASLRILTNGFGHQRNAVHGNLVHGVALILDKYQDMVDEKRFEQKLRASRGPDPLVGEGRALHKLVGGPAAQSAAEVLVREYNKGGGRTLPAWQR